MYAEFLEKLKVFYKQGVLLILFPFELFVYNQGSFTPSPLMQRIMGEKSWMVVHTFNSSTRD